MATTPDPTHHYGPDLTSGGNALHRGARETCPGPSCGPTGPDLTLSDRIRGRCDDEVDAALSPQPYVAAVEAVLNLCERIRHGLDGVSEPEAEPFVTAARWFESAIATAMGIKEET